ncbi:MAG TPA: DUF881 domain-containing protein [Micromonosporaceae bacterium]
MSKDRPSSDHPSTTDWTAKIFGPDFLNVLFRHPLDPGYADAAAKRQQEGPPGRFERLLGRTLSTVALVMVGFLLAVAYLQTVTEEPERAKVRAALAEQIRQRNARTDELAARAEELRAEVARLRDSVLSSDDAARLRMLEATVGLARVRGDGVVVTVADAPPDAVTGTDPKLSRVLDRDLQHIANALWSAGAEAIAINGQRLTSTSTIRSAGDAILVDFRPILGPYEVTAIGPKEMMKRFEDSGTARLMRQLVRDYGMQFQVRAADDLTLPAASDPRLRYADPTSTTSPAPSGRGRSLTPSGGS